MGIFLPIHSPWDFQKIDKLLIIGHFFCSVFLIKIVKNETLFSTFLDIFCRDSLTFLRGNTFWDKSDFCSPPVMVSKKGFLWFLLTACYGVQKGCPVIFAHRGKSDICRNFNFPLLAKKCQWILLWAQLNSPLSTF